MLLASLPSLLLGFRNIRISLVNAAFTLRLRCVHADFTLRSR